MLCRFCQKCYNLAALSTRPGENSLLLNEGIRKRKISRESVLMVLERASEDIEFSSQLVGDYPKALKDYNLTSEEGVAPCIGYVHRIESHKLQ